MDATRKPLGRAARFSLLVVMLAAWIVLTCVLGQGLYDSWPAAQSRSAFDGLFPMVFAGCILLELALCAMSIAAWRHVSQPRVRSPLRGMLTITAIAVVFFHREHGADPLAVEHAEELLSAASPRRPIRVDQSTTTL